MFALMAGVLYVAGQTFWPSAESRQAMLDNRLPAPPVTTVPARLFRNVTEPVGAVKPVSPTDSRIDCCAPEVFSSRRLVLNSVAPVGVPGLLDVVPNSRKSRPLLEV